MNNLTDINGILNSLNSFAVFKNIFKIIFNSIKSSNTKKLIAIPIASNIKMTI